MKINVLFEHHEDYDPETVANHIKATVVEGTSAYGDTTGENLPTANPAAAESFLKLHQSHDASQGKSFYLCHTSNDIEFHYTFRRHKTRLEISGKSIPKDVVKEAMSQLTDNFGMKKVKVTYQ